MKKLTIEDAYNLAESRSFKFLSTEFKNTKTKYLWECSKGHEWNSSYDKIRGGKGCPDCGGSKPKTISDAHNLAKSRGFNFLSTEYVNNRTKYLWECSYKHQWLATYGDIQQGSGCPNCAVNMRKTIEDAHNLAKSKGFKFLSSQFKGVDYKYNWECSKRHQWTTTYGSIYGGTGCPICANTIPKTIKDAHNLAESKGFKFLSSQFKGVDYKYNWECSKRHQWTTTYGSIYGGTGCPECTDNYRGEKLTRYCFEKMLLCYFKKIRPDWLRNTKSNRNLELDGFNDKLSLAFEHQGIQHEKDCPTTNKHYDPRVLIRDEIKRQKCKERGIILIEVPEIGTRLKLKDVVPFLLSEFDKHKIAYPESAKSFQIDMKEFYAEYMNEKSTTGVDDLLSELDAMDFSDGSLFVDSIMDEVSNLNFDDPDLFN